MKISLAGIQAIRGDWSLSAEGVFGEGVHLVSGDVGSGKSTLALLLAVLYVPGLQKAFDTVTLEGWMWGIILPLVLFPALTLEVRKLVVAWRRVAEAA